MPQYAVAFSAAARQALRRMDRSSSRRIVLCIEQLQEDPRPSGCKKLAGSEFWRIRVGDHRVIYTIQDRQLSVLVIRIGHRRDIYR